MLTNLKYIFYLLVAILGNPFYQMISYFVCQSLGWGEKTDFNTYQVNFIGYLICLVVIFLIRLLIYSRIFFPQVSLSKLKGKSSYLYIFAERHLFQVFGAFTFWLWAQELEGNVAGIIAFPLTIITGLIISIITFIRLLKLRKKFSAAY